MFFYRKLKLKFDSFKRLSTCAAVAMAFSCCFASCGGDDEPSIPVKPETPAPTPGFEGFAKGADVSWLTELEQNGQKYYDSKGVQRECMELLKNDYGIDAIRLRVWVNPKDGWNGKEDVLRKAERAAALGQRLMIDFHFSDSWADPGQQNPPAAWKDYNLEQLCAAITAHVNDVLGALKTAGIKPEWVQIGNETPAGMMFPVGQMSGDNAGGFPAMVDAGYYAVKSVFPDAKVIVHVDQGQNAERSKWLFDHLKRKNTKYDMIGLSLYPEPATYKDYAKKLLENSRNMTAAYGKPVILCEIGMPVNEAEKAYDLIKSLREEGEKSGVIEGIFYWEPEAPDKYNGGYDKGALLNDRFTKAMDAFK